MTNIHIVLRCEYVLSICNIIIKSKSKIDCKKLNVRVKIFAMKCFKRTYWYWQCNGAC